MKRSAAPGVGKLVELDAVRRSYGPVVAVDDVTIAARPGEFLSLLGPSGSGKTTLLMMIAGFETPDSGRIRIDGADITAQPANRRGIGMVFQRYALFPHMTVAENIAFPLKMRRFARAEIARKVEEALALVRLEGYGGRAPAQLSGGQQQRVAVARALVFEPPVLLMDEPLGALDKKLREQMQIEIKAIQERLGVTVIYVTHDQEEALTMSDRIAVLNGGEVAQLGTPDELYDNPSSPFVADFIGKMNLLDGVYRGRANGDTVVEATGGFRLRRSSGAEDCALVAGAPVQLAIRPEKLTLTARGQGGENAVPGIVEAAIFTGAHRVYLVGIDGRRGDPLQVLAPANSACVRGEAVDVVFDPAGLHVFGTKP